MLQASPHSRKLESVRGVKAGSSQSTIAAYELRAKHPTWGTIERLAAAVGLEPVVSYTPLLQYADFKSLCFHRAVAEALKRDPGQARERAGRHLSRLKQLHPHAAGAILDSAEILVIGSQAIHASIDFELHEAGRSIEPHRRHPYAC